MFRTIKMLKNYSDYKRGFVYKVTLADAIVLVSSGYAIFLT